MRVTLTLELDLTAHQVVRYVETWPGTKGEAFRRFALRELGDLFDGDVKEAHLVVDVDADARRDDARLAQLVIEDLDDERGGE